MALFEEDEDPPKRDKVRRTLEELEVDYENAGIELVQVASGYRFQARAAVAPWMNRLFEERRPKYSRALLETIAIIAYRQPITRGEIENIRGVAVSTGIIRTLLEREWVRVVGHRDVPGKPAVYATTKAFLDYFNLASIDQLPSLAELKDFDDINADLFRDQGVDEGGEGREPPASDTAVSEKAQSEAEVATTETDEQSVAEAEHPGQEDGEDTVAEADIAEPIKAKEQNSEDDSVSAVEAPAPTINRIQTNADEHVTGEDEQDEISVSGQST